MAIPKISRRAALKGFAAAGLGAASAALVDATSAKAALGGQPGQGRPGGTAAPALALTAGRRRL